MPWDFGLFFGVGPGVYVVLMGCSGDCMGIQRVVPTYKGSPRELTHAMVGVASCGSGAGLAWRGGGSSLYWKKKK